MKIAEAIAALQTIKEKFGNIPITGGSLHDDTPPSSITVTDVWGMEVWPNDPNVIRGKHEIDGVFIE